MARTRRSLDGKQTLLAFATFVFSILYLFHIVSQRRQAYSSRLSEQLDAHLAPTTFHSHSDIDLFGLMLNPATSKRDNFGLLFRDVLIKAGKIRGNFLEIGGGEGKFFDHNMESFGDSISHYYVIEPYKLLSDDGKPLPSLMAKFEKWSSKLHEQGAHVEIVHDFSTNKQVIDKFQDGFFDFIYIDGDHSYKGAKSDLINFYPKVRVGGVIAGHDYCCSEAESKATIHAPWCGKYIYPHSASNPLKHGKEKVSWCGIFKGAEEFAKENNFYWLYTLEGRCGQDAAGLDNPSYFTVKQDPTEYMSWQGDHIRRDYEKAPRETRRSF